MVTAGDFRNGMTIQMDGSIWQVIEFQHVKPGKGSPFVRTKLKNIKSGGVVEKSFRPTEKFDAAHIERKDMQYLYAHVWTTLQSMQNWQKFRKWIMNVSVKECLLN